MKTTLFPKSNVLCSKCTTTLNNRGTTLNNKRNNSEQPKE